MKKIASKSGSQLILKDDGKYTFNISKSDWEKVGQDAGWGPFGLDEGQQEIGESDLPFPINRNEIAKQLGIDGPDSIEIKGVAKSSNGDINGRRDGPGFYLIELRYLDVNLGKPNGALVAVSANGLDYSVWQS